MSKKVLAIGTVIVVIALAYTLYYAVETAGRGVCSVC
jgi:hypothetical protein